MFVTVLTLVIIAVMGGVIVWGVGYSRRQRETWSAFGREGGYEPDSEGGKFPAFTGQLDGVSVTLQMVYRKAGRLDTEYLVVKGRVPDALPQGFVVAKRGMAAGLAPDVPTEGQAIGSEALQAALAVRAVDERAANWTIADERISELLMSLAEADVFVLNADGFYVEDKGFDLELLQARTQAVCELARLLTPAWLKPYAEFAHHRRLQLELRVGFVVMHGLVDNLPVRIRSGAIPPRGSVATEIRVSTSCPLPRQFRVKRRTGRGIGLQVGDPGMDRMYHVDAGRGTEHRVVKLMMDEGLRPLLYEVVGEHPNAEVCDDTVIMRMDQWPDGGLSDLLAKAVPLAARLSEQMGG